MSKYVDGFVLVVPKKNVKKYVSMAKGAGKMWKKLGALDYFECMGDDLNPNTHGTKMLGFPRMTKLKKDETAWFSFITYKSKAHRDAINKKVHSEMDKMMEKHPEYKDMPMPWVMKRFSYAGFKTMVEF